MGLTQRVVKIQLPCKRQILLAVVEAVANQFIYQARNVLRAEDTQRLEAVEEF
jgi:hypothetical protein